MISISIIAIGLGFIAYMCIWGGWQWRQVFVGALFMAIVAGASIIDALQSAGGDLVASAALMMSALARAIS